MTDRCPTCGEPLLYRCRCLLSDMRCAAGHEWHLCPECRLITKGVSDHAADAHDSVNLCDSCRAARQRADDMRSYTECC